jgi:FtsP/CotA-like multicopper oxidase with cupredoxin domain
MLPAQVTRIIVRWAPQDVTVNAASAGHNKYSFDPTVGPGYVWHCHIVDHEDNEMMRPYEVQP